MSNTKENPEFYKDMALMDIRAMVTDWEDSQDGIYPEEPKWVLVACDVISGMRLNFKIA